MVAQSSLSLTFLLLESSIMLLNWMADMIPLIYLYATYSVSDIAPAAEFDVVEEFIVPQLTENACF